MTEYLSKIIYKTIFVSILQKYDYDSFLIMIDYIYI